MFCKAGWGESDGGMCLQSVAFRNMVKKARGEEGVRTRTQKETQAFLDSIK